MDPLLPPQLREPSWFLLARLVAERQRFGQVVGYQLAVGRSVRDNAAIVAKDLGKLFQLGFVAFARGEAQRFNCRHAI